MSFHTHMPPFPLSDLVHLFWLNEGYAPPHDKERVLPTGTMQLIINLRDDAFRVFDPHNRDHLQCYRGVLISGPRSEFVVIDTASQEATIGVDFKPGGAIPFFGIPASELRNTNLSLDTVWGQGASELRERLLEAVTPAERFRILEAFLLSRASRSLSRHPVVAFALTSFNLRQHRYPLRPSQTRSGSVNGDSSNSSRPRWA